MRSVRPMLEYLLFPEGSLLRLKVAISAQQDTILGALLSQERDLGKKVPQAATTGGREGYRLTTDWFACQQEQQSFGWSPRVIGC